MRFPRKTETPQTGSGYPVSLLVEYIRREIDELHRNNVRLVVMGIIKNCRPQR
ncbi:MAG: hypothetical protein ACLT0Y_04045 [Christensenellales bacterium]